MQPVFIPQPNTLIAIHASQAGFPVRRIYCVGRNYAAHAKEMGVDPAHEAPFFFSKPADAVVANGADIVYPPRTKNLHHEIELVVAIGKAGYNINPNTAEQYIYGYAVGNDLTRRDLQAKAKQLRQPWETSKAFDCSAPISKIFPATQVGHIRTGAIWLKVNNEIRQQADIGDLIWSIPKLIAELSCLFELKAGDLIFTGAPAGVAAVEPGDLIEGYVDGLEVLSNRIVIK